MSVGPGDGHAHGSGNPHYWLDPKNAEIITAHDPRSAGADRSGQCGELRGQSRWPSSLACSAKLAEWEARLAPLKGMPIVAYHNSWPYFARRFRLDFVGFIETKPGVPPSPAHLAGDRAHHAGARRPHRRARAARAGTRRRLRGGQGRRIGRDAGGLGRRAAARRRLHRAVRRQCRGAASAAAAMIEPLAFLWPPFLVAVCLVGIHAYFGIQVLARKVIFVDLALAQIAALGATVAFMLGHPAQSAATYGYSLAFTLLAAVLLAFTRAWGTRVPQEALIGVIYVVAAAAAILLIDRAPQGAEHLKQILTGNILTSGLERRCRHRSALCRDRAAALAVAPPADRRGVARLGIRLLRDVRRGGDQLGRDCRRAAGVFVSHHSRRHRRHVRVVARHDSSRSAGLPARSPAPPALPPRLPSICRPAPPWSALSARRWRLPGCSTRFCAAIAATRCASRSQPRAGAPPRSSRARRCSWRPRRAPTSRCIDLAEYAVPSLRALYFTPTEQATFADAGAYAERYRMEAEQLNELERRNRTEGEALDDFAVARISSFLKSYGEMRKGEQFVMGEVRARARERVRWGASLGLLAFALLLAPLPWRRLWAR